MVIHSEREELEAVAAQINAWGEEMKAFVGETATRQVGNVEGMSFQGLARESFVRSFHEMRDLINQQIEQITDDQIRVVGERLKAIGVAFDEVDQTLAQY
jgi:hypothetical protein